MILLWRTFNYSMEIKLTMYCIKTRSREPSLSPGHRLSPLNQNMTRFTKKASSQSTQIAVICPSPTQSSWDRWAPTQQSAFPACAGPAIHVLCGGPQGLVESKAGYTTFARYYQRARNWVSRFSARGRGSTYLNASLSRSVGGPI